MSVRDRIKAAEQASGSDNAPDGRPFVRRGTKLSLNTDEHIKEEFFRPRDGGWHKRVDIGLHQKFVAPPVMPPVIKLTSDTPLVTTPPQQLPGKVDLSKTLDMRDPVSAVGGANVSRKETRKGVAKDIIEEVFPVSTEQKAGKGMKPASGDVTSPTKNQDWRRVERLEAEQQEAMDLAEGKTRHEEWDRVAAMEAAQQAEMDAAAILAEAEKEEVIPKKTESRKPLREERHKEWEDAAAREAKQQAEMDADAILADFAKDDKSKRALDLEAEAFLAEFEREEKAKKKKVPGAFEDEPELETKKAPSKSTATRAGPKPKEATRKQSTRDIPTRRFEDLLDEDVIIDEPPSRSRSRSHERTRTRSVFFEEEEEEEEEEELGYVKPKPSPRERILFDPVEYRKKKQARQERRASRQKAKDEEYIVADEVEERPRSHNRANRSPSILLVHVNDDEDDRPSHKHRQKHRSRSRSNYEHEERASRHSHSHSQDEHRRSSSSLWPSFSNSERRSVSEMLDPSAVPRSSHHRKHSDSYSTASARSEISVKKLEAVEYVAGKRLEHIPLLPPKSPPRPAGFVRSRSHAGEYSEGFTHNKKLLRKPSNEDVIVERVDHDWEAGHRKSTSGHSRSKSKDEPWQIKLLHEIARR